MRRRFLARAGALAGAAVTANTLSLLTAHTAWAASAEPSGHARITPSRDYGPLAPVPDADGNIVLALPEGFRYVTFSRTGEAYAPGRSVPRNHDGMACFPAGADTVRLIRNHEVRNPAGDFITGLEVPAHLAYDPAAMAGCMALDFDTRARRLVRQFPAIGGTLVNCAGGYAYRDAGWLTCEETVLGVNAGYTRPHGYTFFVPASAQSTVVATPLTAMGRFVHEAATADVRGIVYLTEDAGVSSGFYRYTPEQPDDLARGRLQMLAVQGKPQAQLQRHPTPGVALPVRWVNVDDPDPALERGAATCFAQGHAQGGAAFERLEGVYRGEDGVSMYFVSTSGGAARGSDDRGYGQIWRYTPAKTAGGQDALTLIFDSPAASVLESPDNLCVTPRGALLLCEDDNVGNGDAHPLAGGITEVNRLIGLARGGEPFEFAVNVWNASELAGACFSPDGEILFVNLYGDARPGSGMTCAIWGPWSRGPL